MPFDENLLKRLRENDTSLTSIYLYDQNPKLTVEDIEALVDALHANTYLKKLFIGGNDIGDKGAILLAQHTRIIELDISDNNISDEGAKAFANHQTLKILNCEKNMRLSVESIEHLVRYGKLDSLFTDYANRRTRTHTFCGLLQSLSMDAGAS